MNIKYWDLFKCGMKWWWVKLVLQVGTPLLFSPFLFTSSTALKCAFVVLVMAVYW